MPRTVDEAAHARRRDVFLDAAQSLMGSKGYERMSVQDVLDEAGASRGAFYHYFTSKQELLTALVARFGDAMAAVLEPVVAEERLSSLDKLRSVLAELAVRKDEEREALVSTLRVWYSDANARARQKVRAGIIDRLADLLRPVVAQGVREAAFEVPDLAVAARVVATLIQDLHDDLADQAFAPDAVDRTFTGYTWAIERILAAPHGSLAIDTAAMRASAEPR